MEWEGDSHPQACLGICVFFQMLVVLPICQCSVWSCGCGRENEWMPTFRRTVPLCGNCQPDLITLITESVIQKEVVTPMGVHNEA